MLSSPELAENRTYGVGLWSESEVRRKQKRDSVSRVALLPSAGVDHGTRMSRVLPSLKVARMRMVPVPLITEASPF